MYFFNNISLVSKLRVIKVLLKSDIAFIWINIWDFQSSTLAKTLINCCFNIGSYITTICGTNINPRVSQCKNCWKWGCTIFTCYIQGLRCIKYSSLYKTNYHYYFVWYCKANFKTNPLYLKIKQGELCSHMFKYLNCKREHQADLNICPFWKYYFNKE